MSDNSSAHPPITIFLAPGSYSSDTLSPKHLILRFSFLLKQITSEQASPNLDDLHLAKIAHFFPDLDEANSSLVEDLIEVLNSYCPPGYYFGTSEGDGACFGVFHIEDSLDLIEVCDHPSLHLVSLSHEGTCINKRYACTLCDWDTLIIAESPSLSPAPRLDSFDDDEPFRAEVDI